MRTLLAIAALALLFVAPSTLAQRLRLFLADGTEITVREYQVLEDRVRYFSIERNGWEEIPTELIDLDRSKEANQRAQKELEARRAETKRERAAERRARTELHQVPLDDGVYHLRGDEILPIDQVFITTRGSKKRTLVKVLSPVPLMTDKQSLTIEGTSAKLMTTDPKPIFYMRLERFTRFGIVRVQVEPKKNQRVVQEIHSHPKMDESVELQEDIEIFRQQLAPTVYKVWPMQDLAPGEYALIEYTPEKADLRVWDFTHSPGKAPAPKS